MSEFIRLWPCLQQTQCSMIRNLMGWLVLTCGHVFHTDCIQKWLESGSNSCPQCRKKFERNQIIKLYFSEGESENNLITELEEANLKSKEECLKFQKQNADFRNRMRNFKKGMLNFKNRLLTLKKKMLNLYCYIATAHIPHLFMT